MTLTPDQVDAAVERTAFVENPEFNELVANVLVVVRADDLRALRTSLSQAQAALRDVREAARPFADFDHAGWEGTVWDGRDDETVVKINHATGRQITLGDFRRISRLVKS